MYIDSTNTLRVGYLYSGSWHSVDSMHYEGGGREFGIFRNCGAGEWYYYGGGFLDRRVRGWFVGENQIQYSKYIVDPPLLGYYDQQTFALSPVSIAQDSSVVAFGYFYEAGLLGGPWCTASFTQFSSSHALRELQSGCGGFGSGSGSSPLTAGSNMSKAFVVTEFWQPNVQTSYDAYLLDSLHRKEWRHVLSQVDKDTLYGDGKRRNQLSASSNSPLVVLGWISQDTLRVKALDDTVWFMTKTYSESVSDGSRRHPRLVVGQDSSVWTAYSALSNGNQHIFLSRIRPAFRIDTILTTIDLHESIQPNAFNLAQNFPNPFNPITTIEFGIPRSSNVTLNIYTLLGQKVATAFSGHLTRGTYRTRWDGSNHPSGVYIYQLQADGYTASKKLVLIK